MTIIDCHTHIGRNEKFQGIKQLLESMDKANIDKALVFASRVGDCPNEHLLQEIAPHKDRLYGVAYFDGQIGYKNHGLHEWANKVSDWYGEKKIVAVKFYTGYEHYYPVDQAPFLAHLNFMGCPAIFHSGDCLAGETKAKLKYAHPLHIDEVAVDFQNMNFVIAHLGFPWNKDAAQVCYKNTNVYADMSGFVYGKFKKDDCDKFDKVVKEFIEICPSEKLMFGSDWPISDQISYVSASIVSLSFHDRDKMLFKTAQKVFKLSSS